MKKIYLLILTITTLKVAGQTHLIGVKGGTNWMDITSANFLSQTDYKKGITSGLTYEYLFKSHFSVGTDLIYNQRGFTNDVVFTDYFGNQIGDKRTAIYKYDYLSLPIKVGFNIGTTFYGFTNIGFIPSVLMMASSMSPTLYNGSESVDVTSRVSKFDLAGFAEIGGGYKFKNSMWLYTSFAYLHGFTTITNSAYFPSSAIRHKGMTLTVGVKFALSKKLSTI